MCSPASCMPLPLPRMTHTPHRNTHLARTVVGRRAHQLIGGGGGRLYRTVVRRPRGLTRAHSTLRGRSAAPLGAPPPAPHHPPGWRLLGMGADLGMAVIMIGIVHFVVFSIFSMAVFLFSIFLGMRHALRRVHLCANRSSVVCVCQMTSSVLYTQKNYQHCVTTVIRLAGALRFNYSSPSTLAPTP